MIAVGMIEKHLTCALDCGTNTGIAIYDFKQKKITETHSTDFFGAFKILKNLDRNITKIIVEVPASFVYNRNNNEKGPVRDSMCFKMGGTRRESQLMAIGCRLLGFSVKEVLPVRAAKWTAEDFKRYLGFDGRTNQHVRDAGRLAFFHSSDRF